MSDETTPQDGKAMSPASAGSRPVAWLAVAADGSESSAVYAIKEQAEAAARDWGWQIVPLYPFPALWPEDEIAIEAAWERTGLKPTWPDDEPQTGVRCANAMADEILRLRLTDEDRDAILFCVSCAQDYRDTLVDVCDQPEHGRATQMIAVAMRVAMPNVGPAPVERGGATSVIDVGGAGPTTNVSYKT